MRSIPNIFSNIEQFCYNDLFFVGKISVICSIMQEKYKSILCLFYVAYCKKCVKTEYERVILYTQVTEKMSLLGGIFYVHRRRKVICSESCPCPAHEQRK